MKRAITLAPLLLALTACTPEGYPEDRFELVVTALTILLILGMICGTLLLATRRRR